MEERKRRFQDKEDVFPAIRDRVQRSFASGVFGGTHVFTASSDVPDDWQLRLVVLPPDAAFSRSGGVGNQSLAIDRANEILKNRGDQPRFKQNRLIFLAADYDSVSRLKDQVRSTLAWQSIVSDIKEMKLNLDQFQSRQASKSLDDANEALRRMIRETYKWLLAPMQEARPAGANAGLSEIQWEHFPVNPGAQNLSQEIERVLKENELLITEWAPIHLAALLKTWFWKDGVQGGECPQRVAAKLPAALLAALARRHGFPASPWPLAPIAAISSASPKARTRTATSASPTASAPRRSSTRR
jgi:predicted AAA+ superfamily ATPase